MIKATYRTEDGKRTAEQTETELTVWEGTALLGTFAIAEDITPGECWELINGAQAEVLVTVAITGAAADYISASSMVEEPSDEAERAFAAYWNAGQRRNSGRGYRLLVTAPAWVFAWVADSLATLTGAGVDVTATERAAARKTVAAIDTALSRG